jgi:hypothetical protein
MYSTRTGLILGFHGCDQTVVDKVLNDKDSLQSSNNVYDWLGSGIYFWDNSPSRALSFAKTLQKLPYTNQNTKITKPAVLGAVLDLGFCLDLLDYENLKVLKLGHEILVQNSLTSGAIMPQNKSANGSKDLLHRELDCAVIQTLHKVREDNNQPAYDSLRGVFWEGKELYKKAGFKSKNHIQICIRNPNCIKGFFLPRKLNSDFPKV